jgi:hypothetical protein
MIIELTPPQQEALDRPGELPRVVDPRTNASYVLVPVSEFEAFQQDREEERQQRSIRRVGLRNAVGRMGDEP